MEDFKREMMMVDVESFVGLCQIGACKFNPYETEIKHKFLENISIQSSLDHNLKISSGEIKFWIGTEHNPSFLENPITLEQALGRFRQFCSRDMLVWSHNYDIGKLQEAYNAIGERLPFPYRNWRDIRTLISLAKCSLPKRTAGDPKTHNALEDAIYQVQYVSKMIKSFST